MTAVLPEAVRVAKASIEVWHQSEARVGQQRTVTYVWAYEGSWRAALRQRGRYKLALGQDQPPRRSWSARDRRAERCGLAPN